MYQHQVGIYQVGQYAFFKSTTKMGKVHGGLARAGKVKRQTPKVEKQEKKKQKTGRAKKRIQYNRRFVNVVTGLGKKRGPNSNADKQACLIFILIAMDLQTLNKNKLIM
eukprot:TRINITY_DN3437_c0_g2_i4.p2 TRINITY_DN3437_c0_g2~~TRINITY_DN3437_c0_g2_i4.p2  ORF type:complete len:109 (+),score=13.75 TRINITY_DN3437_c0_g2_i4:29-355(+)